LNRYKDDILIHRFLKAAESYSSQPALDIKGGSISYQDLVRVSSNIASKIISISDKTSPVAILAARNITAYAGILAALITGRPYLPLNPRFPVNRNLKMIQRSGTDTIITADENSSITEEIILQSSNKLNIINPETDGLINMDAIELDYSRLDGVNADQTAYLLFTSGTTGEPKGVPVSNKNVTAYLDHMLGHYDFNENDRFSQTFDLTFDLSVHDLFACWLSGACLCIPDSEKPFAYPKYINDYKITVWFSVPSMAVLMDKMRLLRPGFFPSLRWSFFCGEPLLGKTANAWQQVAPASGVVNLYGPSETTIAISAYQWQPEKGSDKTMNGIVSIGKVFNKQHYRLLDEKDLIVSPGKQGFLHFSGNQVIQSYLEENDNNMSFKYLKEKGEERWYNTGDLVVEDDEHDLFFLGRADHEVKISGYRVNLLEIDDTLRKMTADNSVATIAVMDEKSDTQYLISFIEAPEDEFNEQKLLEICRNQLPWYMVPQRIIQIDQLPLNENGKIDRKKLSEH